MSLENSGSEQQEQLLLIQSSNLVTSLEDNRCRALEGKQLSHTEWCTYHHNMENTESSFSEILHRMAWILISFCLHIVQAAKLSAIFQLLMSCGSEFHRLHLHEVLFFFCYFWLSCYFSLWTLVFEDKGVWSLIPEPCYSRSCFFFLMGIKLWQRTRTRMHLLMST